MQTSWTEVMKQFAKYTVWKLLTCNLNLKDKIGDLSNTVEGLDDNIQDNSAKIEETQNLTQNLENSFDENQAKIQENENDFITLNGTVHDNFVKIKAFENHGQDLNDLQDTVHDLNNTILDNSAKIKGINIYIYIRSAIIL